MNENTHSLLGPYVVGAVSDQERAEFELHLQACDECRQDVVTLRNVTTSMADAEAITPPASLRSRVMNQVAQTPQQPPMLTNASGTTGSDSHVDAEDFAQPAEQDDSRRSDGDQDVVPINRRSRWSQWALAAASVAAVGAIAIGVGMGLGDGKDPDLVALEREVVKVTNAPDAQSLALDLGTSYMVMSERIGSVVAVGDGVPALGDDTEYQLWIITTEGAALPGPTFTPDADGEFVAIMEGDMSTAAAFAVTVEPAGGSDAPTTDPLAVTEL